MARGRQQKWVCKDCKADFQVQGRPPLFCCFCGSSNIGRAPSAELALAYEEKRKELSEVCAELAPVYEQYAELREKCDKLMSYWKQQRRRGFISEEEYEELAAMVPGAKAKNDPNTEDTANCSNTSFI